MAEWDLSNLRFFASLQGSRAEKTSPSTRVSANFLDPSGRGCRKLLDTRRCFEWLPGKILLRQLCPPLVQTAFGQKYRRHVNKFADKRTLPNLALHAGDSCCSAILPVIRCLAFYNQMAFTFSICCKGYSCIELAGRNSAKVAALCCKDR
eukprot:5956046-Amphidinium_carterae.1